jgi:hypothetical protein
MSTRNWPSQHLTGWAEKFCGFCMYNRPAGGNMNHRGTTGTGRPSTAAAASSADILESQNEAMLTTLQSKISTLKNVMKAKLNLICLK